MSRENIKTIIAEYEQKKKELNDVIRVGLKDAFTDFFIKYPMINNINFLAFIPYFNDGEACVFNLHEILFSAEENVEDVYRSKYCSGVSGYFTGKGEYRMCCDDDPCEKDEALMKLIMSWTIEQQKEFNHDFHEIAAFLVSIKSFIQNICGSHCWIKIDKNGLHVTEYEDHD